MLFSNYIFAEIPDWYIEGVSNHINDSKVVVLYKTESVELVKKQKVNQYITYYTYKINTVTIDVLKGTVPREHCYYIHTEGNWKGWDKKIGVNSLAILRDEPDSDCSLIDTGYGAPGTPEYVDLFKSVINAPNKSLNKDATKVAPIS